MQLVENTRTCITCQLPLVPRPNELNNDFRRRKFCNLSCAAKTNNRVAVKRPRLVQICQRCPSPLPYAQHRRRFCDSCLTIVKAENVHGHPVENRTKGELFSIRSNWQSARTAIRNHANIIYRRSGKNYDCYVCGYSKHVQICHIQSVSTFPSAALVKEINAVSNLVALCPNHHWEFDHGTLSLEEATGVEPAILTL